MAQWHLSGPRLDGPEVSETCCVRYSCLGRVATLAPQHLLILTVHQPPVQQGVVDEGFQHGHDAVLVFPEHLHHRVARDSVVAIQTGNLQQGHSHSPEKALALAPAGPVTTVRLPRGSSPPLRESSPPLREQTQAFTDVSGGECLQSMGPVMSRL